MDEDQRKEWVKDMVAGTPRAARARRFADTILGLMRDYLPRTRDSIGEMNEHLTQAAWLSNLSLINVPPEWDALTKLEIENAMLQTKVGRLTIPTPPGI